MPFSQEARKASVEMKACAQCKYRRDHPTSKLKTDSVCEHPDLPFRQDYVTGDPLLDYCSTQRGVGGQCGVEGKLFKESEDEMSEFREKSIDWWRLRHSFSRYMYHESAEHDFDSDKCFAARDEYLVLRKTYQEKYKEDFDFAIRPIDVSEECPDVVKGF